MKILIISSLFPNEVTPINGIYNFSRSKALKNTGAEILVISPIGLTPQEKSFKNIESLIKAIKIFIKIFNIPILSEYEGVKVYYPKWFWLPKRYFWKYEDLIFHLFAGRKVKQMIMGFNPDLIITSWLHPWGSYSNYINKFYRGKTILISEGSDILINPFHYPGWDSIEKNINKSNGLLVFVSNNQKAIVEKKLNLKKGVVIQNGFNVEYFSEVISYKEIKFENKIYLITVGNLRDIKGHDLLLNALLLLDTKYHLKIIGDGEDKQKYIEFIRNNDLEERVEFLGQFQNNELNKILIKADIYCQASRSEGLPAAPLEAMGCGLPIVASRVGGLPEIIIDNFNGFLFESENINDLVAKIELASSTVWNNEMISSWVKCNFSWDKWANEVLKFNTNKNDYLI